MQLVFGCLWSEAGNVNLVNFSHLDDIVAREMYIDNRWNEQKDTSHYCSTAVLLPRFGWSFGALSRSRGARRLEAGNDAFIHQRYVFRVYTFIHVGPSEYTLSTPTRQLWRCTAATTRRLGSRGRTMAVLWRGTKCIYSYKRTLISATRHNQDPRRCRPSSVDRPIAAATRDHASAARLVSSNHAAAARSFDEYGARSSRDARIWLEP